MAFSLASVNEINRLVACKHSLVVIVIRIRRTPVAVDVFFPSGWGLFYDAPRDFSLASRFNGQAILDRKHLGVLSKG